jgi:hypothetical protein
VPVATPMELSLLLRQTVERELPNLQNLTDIEAAQNDGRPDSWSRKEELGHLIDSATNNHIRFVLASTGGEYRGTGYAQNDWVAAHGYQDLPWAAIVDFWYGYNMLLVHLISRMSEAPLNNRCVIGWGVQTLRFLIEDYVLHMRHHLDHVLARDTVTAYPGTPAGVK